ncbi:MAG: HAD family phosphatase [Bifidobacteriaceae bacterium]|jgi:HAD superfamily hydrolase (TIGR01509 family)|nr:HAD family phosphatase [Bifidobacteriaceae bacterium]
MSGQAASGNTGRDLPMGASRLKGVLWDLDGTVMDSEPAWYEAESTLVERFGGDWSQEQAAGLLGSDLQRTAAVLQGAGVSLETRPLIEALTEIVARRVLASQPWRPGVREALVECRTAGVPCGLVSMSWRRFTWAVAGLVPGMFAAVVSGDDVTRGKPDPEAYLMGAAKLGLEPADCVAVEDSPTGVAAARAAGITVIAVPGTTDAGKDLLSTGFGSLAELGPGCEPGLTVLRSTAEISLELLRQIHSGSSALDRQTTGIGPEKNTSRRAGL